MKRFFFFGIILTLAACQKKISTDDLPLLNGYWEIKQVGLPDGTLKEYTINTTVDYIEVKDLSGFRKKVYPQLDGTFDTSNDVETFSLIQGPDGIEIHYKTEHSEWTEKLLALNDGSFTVTNAENKTYTYHRFQPINIKK